MPVPTGPHPDTLAAEGMQPYFPKRKELTDEQKKANALCDLCKMAFDYYSVIDGKEYNTNAPFAEQLAQGKTIQLELFHELTDDMSGAVPDRFQPLQVKGTTIQMSPREVPADSLNRDAGSTTKMCPRITLFPGCDLDAFAQALSKFAIEAVKVQHTNNVSRSVHRYNEAVDRVRGSAGAMEVSGESVFRLVEAAGGRVSETEQRRITSELKSAATETIKSLVPPAQAAVLLQAPKNDLEIG